jgi:hypothetical protein
MITPSTFSFFKRFWVIVVVVTAVVVTTFVVGRLPGRLAPHEGSRRLLVDERDGLHPRCCSTTWNAPTYSPSPNRAAHARAPSRRNRSARACGW